MKYLFSVIIILVVFSCKQKTEPEVKTAPSQKVEKDMIEDVKDLNETKSKTEVTFISEEATQIHEAYLELKGALVNTDANQAAEIAEEYGQMLGAIAEDTSIIKLKEALDIIARSTNAKDQRAAFENVSITVENYLTDQIDSGRLIKQFCPMAFDGRGAYWLSDSKEIRNPYYGDKMLTCGVVDTEIN